MAQPRPRGKGAPPRLAEHPQLARRLAAAGKKRAKARGEADRQLEIILELTREALDKGANLTEIAEASGVSRQTLHKLLGK